GRVRGSDRTAVAIGVRNEMRSRDGGPESLLEGRTDEAQRAHGLAVEAAPERDELVLLRMTLREAQSALDGLRAARIELHAMQLRPWPVRRQPLDEIDPRLARERPDVGARDLPLDRVDDGGVRVSEGVHSDAADEVEEGVPVDIGHRAAFGVIDDETRHQRIAL